MSITIGESRGSVVFIEDGSCAFPTVLVDNAAESGIACISAPKEHTMIVQEELE